jgi:hypothetical protein
VRLFPSRKELIMCKQTQANLILKWQLAKTVPQNTPTAIAEGLQLNL